MSISKKTRGTVHQKPRAVALRKKQRSLKYLMGLSSPHGWYGIMSQTATITIIKILLFPLFRVLTHGVLAVHERDWMRTCIAPLSTYGNMEAPVPFSSITNTSIIY